MLVAVAHNVIFYVDTLLFTMWHFYRATLCYRGICCCHVTVRLSIWRKPVLYQNG